MELQDRVRDVVRFYQRLLKEWAKTPPNLEKCGTILDKLKVALTQMPFLPTRDSTATKKDLLIARDILEVGAQYSIKTKDIPSFERYMAQLKCYYLDYQQLLGKQQLNDLPESASKYQLLGLNLLCLLSQNRVAEFHTELELLPPKEIQTNLYIRHPVSMEQYLMEGSYNKVFLSRENVPAESYYFFINILLDTVRNEIAACIEKAYEKIALKEAILMLFFNTAQEMTEYATKRGWKLQDDFYLYNEDVNKTHSEESIPAFELASQAIEYARELEMIV